CLKKTQFDDCNQLNFSEFDDINKWFVERDIDQVRKNAQECSQSRHSSRMNNLRYSYYSLNSLLRKNTLVFHQKGKVQDTLVTHQVIHQVLEEVIHQVFKGAIHHLFRIQE
ncbi:11535_t:CDS:2, partial [Funneliformis geosporum]